MHVVADEQSLLREPIPGSADGSETRIKVAALSHLLRSFRYRYGSEVQLHEALAIVLLEAGYNFVREYVLDVKNRADFWLDGVVIEIKVAGSLGEALRQADRYIHLPKVKGVILAGTSRWADDALVKRPEWQGKAFQMVKLERQSL